ncbi:histidine kinase [Microbacterium sp. zg.Y625]|uniref:sensor histidine kinase n=1 Tax=Microbacterium jiangjiandongii TaxID=3049071 RepID=UPI00214D0564|nr:MULTISPECIES: histidine kinase [unclassified Microbacterium]MCR2791823.1 histidine kinase [Microbacterium sp. zg.Y625]WIM24640.1 histidine kinase [Microbacterium sp. zg-Y625]
MILAAYLLLAAALGYLSVESTITTPLPPILLVTAGGVAAVLCRHRWPRASFLALLVLMMASAAWGTGAETALVVLALYIIGVTSRAGRAWAAFGVALAAGSVAALILAIRVRVGPPIHGIALRSALEAWPTDWVTMATAFAGAALIATLLGVNRGHRRRHVAALVERAEQIKRERDQQASISRALERERIAREMHDVIAHSLAVMTALADGASAVAPTRPEESQRVMARVADTGRRTLGEVRRLLARVDDDAAALSSAPGPAQLPALAEEFVAAGLPVRLELTGVVSTESAVGPTVYRIVQESLTNVLRHAREVRDVFVRVALADDEVTILVQDSSAPALPTDSPGRGLVGIRERGAFYDGEVEAGPRDDGGWRVFVRLPLDG